MPIFDPNDLANWTGGHWSSVPSAPLTGFCIDTRHIRPGQVFVALKTEKRDGHEYFPAAIAGGASAGICHRRNVPPLALSQLQVDDTLKAFQDVGREHRLRYKAPVIGVTGSCGKTSTKELLASLLGGGDGSVLATEGNLNNHLGVPLTLTRLEPALHRFAVVEAGISAPGEMATLAGMIRPDVAITTLIAPAHLKELGGLQGVAREKAVLSEGVSEKGVAIFPVQCLEFEAFRSLEGRALVIEEVEALEGRVAKPGRVLFLQANQDEKTVLSVIYPEVPPLTFTTRRLSRGMAHNAVLAISAALGQGIGPDVIQERLERWEPVRMRGEIRRENGRLVYLDCYNANPASMADALEAFAAVSRDDTPRLYVLGGMEELGPEAARYHWELGNALSLRPQDQARLVGGHAPEMRAGLLAAGAVTAQVTVAAEATEFATDVANWSGAIFVKGSRRYALERALPGTNEEGAH